MSTLAESIASRGLQAVDEHGEAWLDKGLAAARTAVARRTTDLEEEMALQVAAGGAPSSTQRAERVALELAPVGLDGVESVSPALYRWGKSKVAGVLIRLPDDQERAPLLVLARGLSVEDYLRVSDASTARTGSVTQQREKDAADVIAMAERVGAAALRIGLPFLLAAL